MLSATTATATTTTTTTGSAGIDDGREQPQVLRDGLAREFGAALLEPRHADALAQLEQLSTTYSVAPAQLATRYEAVMLNEAGETDAEAPTLPLLARLRRELQADHERHISEEMGLRSDSFVRRVTKAELDDIIVRPGGGDSSSSVFDNESLQAFLNSSEGVGSQSFMTKTPKPVRTKVKPRQDPSDAPRSSAVSVAKTPAQASSSSYSRFGSTNIPPKPSTGTFATPGARPPQTPAATGFAGFSNFPPSTPSAATPFKNEPAAIGTPMTPNAPPVNFAGRPNKGLVDVTFNESVPLVLARSFLDTSKGNIATGRTPITVRLPPGQQVAGYRYMFEKLTRASDLVDDRIIEMADIILEGIKAEAVAKKNAAATAFDDDGNMKMEIDEVKKEPADAEDAEEDVKFLDPCMPRHEPFYTVGRICCDSPVDGSRLNEQSVVLECSRSLGGGRIQLSLNIVSGNSEPFTLFPGQIVGLLGTNPSGRVLVVQKVFFPPSNNPATTNFRDLLSFYRMLPGSEEAKASTKPPSQQIVNMIVASGPFTLDDSLSYEPLEELMKIAECEATDVVILTGPFVDIAHPLRSTADLSDHEIFAHLIAPHVNRLTAAGTHVVIVPSTKDALTEWIGFPQPPLGTHMPPPNSNKTASSAPTVAAAPNAASLGLTKSQFLHLFPNPVQFTINEVVVAVTSADIIDHVGRQECLITPPKTAETPVKVEDGERKAPPVDRITRLISTVIRQRSLYPLHPPSDQDPNFSVDHSRLNSSSVQLQAAPDILIVPSKIRHAVKLVEGGTTLAINPGGGLVRGRAIGTFARICVHPLRLADVVDMVEDSMKEGEGDDDEYTDHMVGGRTRVEIVKI